MSSSMLLGKLAPAVASFTRLELIYRLSCSYGDPRDSLRPILGPTVSSKLPRLWGPNDEGELSGTWREIGAEGLWNMTGAFAALVPFKWCADVGVLDYRKLWMVAVFL